MPTTELAPAVQWIRNYLNGEYEPLDNPPRVSRPMDRIGGGVYAIQGPNGVYVGQSADCGARHTLRLAVKLGWPCGIVRELPGATGDQRLAAEAQVARLFSCRGMRVISRFSDPTA